MVDMDAIVSPQYIEDIEINFDIEHVINVIEEGKTYEDNLYPDIPKQIDSFTRDIVDNIGLTKTKSYNRAGNKLLNIFRICPFLLSNDSSIFREEITLRESLMMTPNIGLCCDIAAAPGAWSLTFLEKIPYSKVIGVTLPESEMGLPWYKNLLENPRFIHYDYNIVTDQEALVADIAKTGMIDICLCDGRPTTEDVQDTEDECERQRKNEVGVDISICDAGVDFDMLKGVKNFNYQPSQHKAEYLAGKAKLIVSQFSLVLKVSRIDGNAVVKLFNIDNPIIMDATRLFRILFQVHISNQISHY